MVAETLVERWSEPLGHGAILRGLWRAARAKRLPHALLFRGAAGIGKFAAARRTALGLLCERAASDGSPCEVCGACKRALKGNHGDVFTVDVRDEDASVRSEELRIGRFVPRDEPYWRGTSVEEFLSLRPSEGGWRVVIVREVERANHHTQNSMLKMLEEPPDGVLWLLETSEDEALLPTIRSRCTCVEFARLELALVEQLLVEAEPGLAHASELARWSRGSPGRAIDLARRSGFELRALALGTLTGRVAPFEAARAAWELDGEFSGKTPKAAERERARFAFDLWLELLRDVLAYGTGVPVDELAHADAGRGLEKAVLARVPLSIERLLELRGDVELNVDPPALLERGLLALAPLPGGVRTLG